MKKFTLSFIALMALSGCGETHIYAIEHGRPGILSGMAQGAHSFKVNELCGGNPRVDERQFTLQKYTDPSTLYLVHPLHETRSYTQGASRC